MVNHSGNNGTSNGTCEFLFCLRVALFKFLIIILVPPDDELKKILFEYARRALPLNTRLRYLEEEHQIRIGFVLHIIDIKPYTICPRLTKLKKLNRKFSVPSSRKFTAVEEATTVIADIIARDVFQGQGPDTVKIIASLRLNLTVPR